jgi:hypothetical protein
VFIFNPRYCHDDIFCPRRRDCDRIAAAHELRVCANDHASRTRARGKKAEKPRTAASMQCSKDADAKGVHGKERKKFMSECKKAAADKPK